MINVIFTKEGYALGIDITEYSVIPDYIAKLELKDGQSTFIPRYKLQNDGTIIDAYPDKTDEEVVKLLEEEEKKNIPTPPIPLENEDEKIKDITNSFGSQLVESKLDSMKYKKINNNLGNQLVQLKIEFMKLKGGK